MRDYKSHPKPTGTYPNRLGEFVKTTKTAFAKDMNLTNSQLAQLMDGKRLPSVYTMIRAEVVTGLTVQELWAGHWANVRDEILEECR